MPAASVDRKCTLKLFSKTLQIVCIIVIINTLVACNGSDSSTIQLFAVGGTVSGLAGNGMVLQSNSGDTLSITADGDFTFATKLKNGAAYNVTVSSQPTNPSQTCTVNNGGGTVNGSNISEVSITCKLTPK